MLRFKEFIVQEGKLAKALTVAGGVAGALANKIPGVEVSPGAEAVTAIAGATAGNIVGDRIEKLFKKKPPKPEEKRLPHQADPKPMKRQ
jgi:outer membrane lipoprotein SlyB